MSFVSREQAGRVYNLAAATQILTEAVAEEVAKPENQTSTKEAVVMGMLTHLSRQLQLLLECMTGVTPTRSAIEVQVIEPEEVN